MEALELRATPRTIVGKKVKTLRNQDIVPGIIYGHDIGSVAVQFDSREIEKAISQTGTSSTVQVHIDGTPEPYLAIFRDVQYHTIKRNVVHLDLQALNLRELVRVPVSIAFVGVSPAVEDFDGVLIHVLNELEIEALPTALVPFIEVDVSGLVEIGQSLTVGDIVPPDGVTILNSSDETIVQVTWAEAEVEEEAEELEEELEPSEVEVIRRRPDEDEED